MRNRTYKSWASTRTVLGLGIVTLLTIFQSQVTLGSTSISAKELKPFERTHALQDPYGRISKDFKVPKELEERTAFWFDVYTLYGSEEHIIHHTLYPWIIYKVVDTRVIPESPKNRYAKYHKAKQLVKSEVALVRKTLKNLANRKNFNKLSADEQKILSALDSLPGGRRKNLKVAATNMRVQLGQKDFVLSGLVTSSRYLPAMEETFIDHGLPTELTRIPFLESSFNLKAESKVGASGIWQVMPVTGRTFAIVNDVIDERNSPLKATFIAAKLLRQNHMILKDWPLAITAYNHGPGSLQKHLRASKSQNLVELINSYHQGSFKFASSNFYTSFLAVLHAEKYHSEVFANEPILYAEQESSVVVALKKSVRFNHLIRTTGLGKEELLEYNYDLKDAASKNALLPRGYRLFLPANRTINPVQLLDAHPKIFREARINFTAKKPSI